MKQADKFACCAVGKGTKWDFPSKCGRHMAGNFQASSYSGPSLSRDRIEMRINKK